MAVGVNDVSDRARSSTGLPEIRSPRANFRLRRISAMPGCLLHVAVARAAGAGGVQRNWTRPDNRSKRCSCRPKIGRADEAFATAPKSGMMVEWPRWAAADTRPSRVTAKGPLFGGHSKAPSAGFAGGSLIDGSGKGRCERRGDLVRRLSEGLCQRASGQPADVARRVQLTPRKTFGIAVLDVTRSPFSAASKRGPRRTPPRAGGARTR